MILQVCFSYFRKLICSLIYPFSILYTCWAPALGVTGLSIFLTLQVESVGPSLPPLTAPPPHPPSPVELKEPLTSLELKET